MEEEEIRKKFKDVLLTLLGHGFTFDQNSNELVESSLSDSRNAILPRGGGGEDLVIDYAVMLFMHYSGLNSLKLNTTLNIPPPPPSSSDNNNNNNTTKKTNAWGQVNPNSFRVRVGPKYRIHGKKEPAFNQSVYECVAFDLYTSSKRLASLTTFMQMPEEARETFRPYRIPEFFVINFMLPITEPPIFNRSSSHDSQPSVSFHIVFKLTKWAIDNQDHKAVRLIEQFVNHHQTSMRERLKIIVSVQNPEELNLGRIEQALYNKYNGLPFLYRAYNSDYRSYPNCFCAEFDGHRSGYATRKARFALLPFATGIVANIAFLVESETDEEMPEHILGCCQVFRLECINARNFARPMATPAVNYSEQRRFTGRPFSLSETGKDVINYIGEKITEMRHRVSSVYESAREDSEEEEEEEDHSR